MLIQPGGSKARRRVLSPSLIVAVSVIALVAQSACGSDDSKKKAGPTYNSGGEGAGGELSRVGKGGDATATGGEGATHPGGGTSNVPLAGEGAGGGAGAPASSCAKGTADCDDNPDDCETDTTLLTSCGACDVTCSDKNGTVICGDAGCEMTSCSDGFGDCNNSGTDGCEADLTKSESCGVCQHSCGGAACAQGLCAGTQLGSAAAAYRWVSTSDAIYRFSCATPGYFVSTSYSLIRTPLDGSAEVVMASDGKGAGGLTVDDKYVYWAVNGTPAAIFKKAHTAAAAAVPIPVCEPVALPVQLRIQGSAMYWTGLDGIIYTRALSAGVADPGTALVSAVDVKGTGTFSLHQDFVTTPSAMYWMVINGNSALVRTADLNGKNAADVPGAVANSYSKFWVNGEDVYWVRATGAALDGAYHFKKGGAVEALTVQAGLEAVMTDGDFFYALAGDTNLYRGPIVGGATVKLSTAGALAAITDFATADAARIYVLTAFTHGSGFAPAYKMVSFPK